ncbi:MAG: MATE family efflux transporter [Chloroflexota bacterium]|jgi:MATE family multidrug resistance protein
MQTPQVRRRQVFRLAMPAVSELVLNTLVGLVDILLVGQMSMATIAVLGYGVAPALAATGLAGEMFWTMSLLFMAIGTGCTALVARATGAKDPETANTALRQGLLMGLLSAALMSVVAIGFAESVMQVYRSEALVSELGAQFIRILGYSFFPTAIMMIGMASLRGAGDTRTPLMIMIVVNLVNVAISYVLISGGPGIAPMGVEGAAIGAATARTVGGLITFVLLLRGRAGLWLKLQFAFNRDMIQRIVRVGWPFAGEQMVFQGALILFIGMINQLGTAAYAAHNLVIRIESLAFLPGWGYGIAASALVGQALGAKNPDEANAATYEALKQTSLMMVILGGLMALFPQPLLAFFVHDAEVIAAGIIPLQIAGAFQIAMGANFVLSGALRGAGDTRWPLYTKVISTWGLRLPITFIVLLSGGGLVGVWIAMGADFCSQAILAYVRFRQGKWRTMQV